MYAFALNFKLLYINNEAMQDMRCYVHPKLLQYTELCLLILLFDLHSATAIQLLKIMYKTCAIFGSLTNSIIF
jgi:hypothetical protein